MSGKSPSNFSNLPDPDRMDAAELAELYAAGALSAAEQQQLESRLAAGDEDLRREMARVTLIMDALLQVEPIAPPRHLREGIEARIEADALTRGSARDAADEAVGAPSARGRKQIDGEETGDAFVIVRQDEGRWLPTGVRGVRFRQLSASRRANRRTILLQMDPGTQLPDHDHAGLEEVMMISGELRIGSQVLRAGDYFRVGAGVRHDTPVSETGCVCMIVSGYMPFSGRTWVWMAWQAVRGLFGRRGH